MPLQELSPPPPVTGFSTLGNVVAGAGQDYLQRSRQLQDVASQRAWIEKEGDKQREEKLADEQTVMGAKLKNEIALEQQRHRDAGITVLINEGYLDGSKRDDQQAVAAAYQRAQGDGIVKLYQDLLQTPDESGKPLLTTADVSNPALVQAAKDKLGAIKAKMMQGQMAQPANAQATVDSLAQQLAGHQARIAQISAKLDQPPRQYAIGDQEVQALAAQLAEQAKPGSGRNRQAVAQMLSAAKKQLDDQSFIQHSQEVQAATRQLDGERYAEASLTQALDHAMGTGKVFPSKGVGMTPGMLQSPTAPAAPKVANAADIANAMRAVVGGGGSGTAAPAPAGVPMPVDNPTNNGAIAAGNDELKLRAQASLNAAIQEGRQIDQQLASVAAPRLPSLGVGLGGYSVSTYTDPLRGSDQAAQLLKAKAENAAKVRALQSQLIGPSAAGVTAPVGNTATASTPSIGAAQPAPEWWSSQTPPDLR